MKRRHRCWRCVLAAAFLALALLAGLWGASKAYASPLGARKVIIPPIATLHRMTLEREAVRHFGLDAPIARMAAQIHQESAWRANARSPYAEGMAQFTPATAAWLPTVCPSVGPPDAWDPGWSLRAMACYDAWLYGRVRSLQGPPLDYCSRWAFTLRAYNGGEGWLLRERRSAAASGANPNDWRAIERFRVRATWAHRENTDYPRRILLTLEPAYRAAGWPGDKPC